MMTGGEENIKGASWEEIAKENKPSKPKDHLFNVGEMRIMTIGAISRPEAGSDEEVCYLPVGGKADEWIDESTIAKMMPLNEERACFVAGYKAGFREGYELAQEKDQKWIGDFLAHFFPDGNPEEEKNVCPPEPKEGGGNG